MRSPWDITGRSQDDMEALQTDVMRFMAVLGLCLAAIFSLVKSPDFNPSPMAGASAPETLAAGPPEAIPERAGEAPRPLSGQASETVASSPQLTPSSQSTATQDDEGFILEFASAASLRRLVDAGVVALVVSDGSAYWTLSGGEDLIEAPDLPAYYAMAAHTVPDALKQAVRARLGQEAKIWGVQLPATITAQIEDLVGRHDGGVLLISAQGTVSVDGSR